ncbi:hypothetical protein PRIPAC_80549 [Pristionchus pacificus]|uniref:G protein-coupled receptor n=1 Tax=Pristionchus pacificus TaxID=54126 RepID=A0A2A6BVS4_PRIPA|nr:hypothetical protein PRIPAC_80549 [Pristionchus pacificus]|eukprot:PDM69968.1 G protein-coupled receptor [Pristionchus pacificus]
MTGMFHNCGSFYNSSDCRISATFSVSSVVEGRLLYALYVVITALELLAIVVMAVLTRITLVDISKGFVGNAARVALMGWQFGWIGETDSPVALLVLSELRFYWIFLCAYMFSAFVIERLFATLFIADYEAQKRTWITTTLFIGIFTICHVEAAFVIFGSTLGSSAMHSVMVAVGVAVVSATISGVAGAVIFKINASRLKRVDDTCDEYTLGMKYQLLENRRAFKLLLLVSSFSSITVVTACVFLTLGIVMVESSPSYSSMMGAFFDAIVTIGSLAVLCIVIFFEKDWRIIIVQRLGLNRWVEISRDSPIINLAPEESVSMHFAELEKHWNRSVSTV